MTLTTAHMLDNPDPLDERAAILMVIENMSNDCASPSLRLQAWKMAQGLTDAARCDAQRRHFTYGVTFPGVTPGTDPR